MKVKYLNVKDGERLNISQYPNFHKSGSITGMKNLYYGKIDIPNRQATVNYSTQYDDAACKEKAREIYQKNDGKFVTYGGYTGRLKYNESENFYYFMKKGARSKGYYINERQICTGVKEV